MRPLLSLALCSALAAPTVAAAQIAPAAPAPTPIGPQEPPAAPTLLAPLPTIAPTEPAPAPAVAAPPPSAEPAAPAPELAPPTKVAPVIVAKEEKNGVGGVVGTTAAGVAGGAAGAAVAGPVGKFAGGFIAKRIAQGLFGKKDKIPELTVIPQTPSAVAAGSEAAETAPPRPTQVAEER